MTAPFHELTRPDELQLAETLADEIAALLVEAIGARGRATLVVPGGSTPRLLFAALVCHPVPWERVFVTLTDERWVSTRDPASNEAQVRELLLQGAAAKARFVGLKTTAPTPEEALGDVEARLAVVPRPFDVVVVGMGEDGHFASLFPRAPGLEAALEPRQLSTCVAARPEASPWPRISLTLSAIAAGRRVFLYANGAAKQAVLRKALAPEVTPNTTPVSALLRAVGSALTVVHTA